MIVMEDEFELVCYLWCKSHSGCVINDAPDLLCAFAHDNETPEPLPMRPPRHRSLRFAAKASEHEWMRRRANALILERELLSKSAGTLRARHCSLHHAPS